MKYIAAKSDVQIKHRSRSRRVCGQREDEVLTGVEGGQLVVVLCEGLTVVDVRVLDVVPAGFTPVLVRVDTGNQL